jgi:hypothetical protein
MQPRGDTRPQQPGLDRRFDLEQQGSVVFLPIVKIDRRTELLGMDGTAGKEVE